MLFLEKLASSQINYGNYMNLVLCLQEAQLFSPIEYPKPDGVVSFDVPTSLYR